MLRIENISKQYKKKLALNNLSIELTGGVYGLLGPNGAGKTTLINIIVNLISANSGNVYYNDKDINTLKDNYLENLFIVTSINYILV